MINNLEKWEPYSLCSLSPRPKKAHTKQKSYSRQHANHSRICGKQQKESPSRIRVGSLRESTRPAPPPMLPGGERSAEPSRRAALRRDLGVPGAAAYAAAPSLPAPIGAPRSGGREDAVKGVGWGVRKIVRARRGWLLWDGDTKREGSLQGWQGENKPAWEMGAN